VCVHNIQGFMAILHESVTQTQHRQLTRYEYSVFKQQMNSQIQSHPNTHKQKQIIPR